MRCEMYVLVFALWAPIPSAAQVPTCQQPLATLTVPRVSYVAVGGAALEGRVYVYAPEIVASGGSGFKPFQLWIVEGVYGKPFVQPTGLLDEAAFDKLRKSPNVRATAVAVARGDGSDRGQFRVARSAYTVEVLKVILSKNNAVQTRICSQ